jgi:3-hydroxyacyl-CoA dehydrogenase
MTSVTTTLVDAVLVVTIDRPPVNALDAELVGALAGAFDQASRTDQARAIVLLAAGRTFVAGADIAALEEMAWGTGRGAPDMHGLLARIEDSPAPVVVAIHGTALGGGLELAMAGHYRVATPDAQLGQPEVNLGIIPGAEGTQRLPRLVGVEQALAMCVSGKPVKAPDALKLGLVDRIAAADLRAEAIAFAQDVARRAGPHPKTRDRTDRLPDAAALPAMLAAGRDLALKTRKRMEAPVAVVEAIEAAATRPFDEGCRREREIFMQCVQSEQCKALIHGFFAERASARVPGVAGTAPPPIRRVAIVGAGTMGGGIAMACANAGLDVRLTDVTAAAIDRGLATVRRNYQSSVQRGRVSEADAAARLERIDARIGYEGFETADLVIEAVFENLALKQEVFAAVAAAARPECVLASNTSTLDIDAIASATGRAGKVVGLHFFSPANVMRLVEIVRGAATSPETMAAALAFTRKLGKVGVVVGNCRGFVGNRMMFPYMYEAQFLVEDGATPVEVDRALVDFGMAMGIFAVDDMAGLDVAWRIRQELGQFSELGGRKPLVADRLCEAGRIGQKAGRGWYRYGEDRRPEPDADVIALIERVSAEAGIVRRSFSPAEIVERTIYALVNEGARVLEEGFALRASDIDVIYVNGYGFPAWRGGPMFHADRVGLAAVHERVAALHRELGERWQPAPLLARLARDGSTFRAFDRSRETLKSPAS